RTATLSNNWSALNKSGKPAGVMGGSRVMMLVPGAMETCLNPPGSAVLVLVILSAPCTPGFAVSVITAPDATQVARNASPPVTAADWLMASAKPAAAWLMVWIVGLIVYETTIVCPLCVRTLCSVSPGRGTPPIVMVVQGATSAASSSAASNVFLFPGT